MIRLRSLLFCPGNRPDMAAKLGRIGADAVVLDLEDAVPADAKTETRSVTRQAAVQLMSEYPSLPVFVRVNDTESPWIHGDIADALAPGTAGIVLPKLESADQLDLAASMLATSGHGQMKIIGGWETAAGIENGPRLRHPQLLAIYFGAEDYIADVGGERTAGGEEVAYARSRAVMAARIIGVDAIDQVVVDIRDAGRFRAEAGQARQLGFSGKMCLHPAQVAIAHEAFTPTEAEIDRCLRLLSAVNAAELEGRGVVLFEGQMVDVPVIRQAERLLARAGVDYKEVER